MEPINLLVDIHCKIPSWVSNPQNAEYRTNIYRLYLNGDLLTERTWIWSPDHTYISEEIWAYLGKNISYKLELEPIVKNISQAKFRLENFRAKTTYTSQLVNDNLISFTLK